MYADVCVKLSHRYDERAWTEGNYRATHKFLAVTQSEYIQTIHSSAQTVLRPQTETAPSLSLQF